MKFIIAFFFIGFGFCGLQGQNPYASSNDFQFAGWQKSLLSYYDDLVKSNNERLRRGLTNVEMVRADIENIRETNFKEMLNTSLNENKLSRWSKLFVVSHHFEGEVNRNLTTFIFFCNSKSWGITFDLGVGGGQYEVNYDKVKRIKKINSVAESGGNYLLIVSEFDNTMRNINNEIQIGVFPSEELLEIYNKLLFQ